MFFSPCFSIFYLFFFVGLLHSPKSAVCGCWVQWYIGTSLCTHVDNCVYACAITKRRYTNAHLGSTKDAPAASAVITLPLRFRTPFRLRYRSVGQ